MGEASFEDFVLETHEYLSRLARTLALNEQDAQDLVQETFVRLGVKWRRLHRMEEPVAYARRTLVNLHIDGRRRKFREMLMPEAPDRPVTDEERTDMPYVARLLEGLTPKQRSCVVLAYIEDLDTQEIASLLDCRAVTVRTHLSRGLARIRAQMHTMDVPNA